MKKLRISKFAGLVAIGALLTTMHANATLTIDSPGVVGTHDGNTATLADALAVAQQLLNMPANTTSGAYQTSSTDYSGIITSGKKSDDAAPRGLGLGANAYQVPAGWQYVLAKYDGPNAGSVLFYLGGVATDLPQFPANLWTSNPEQYGISHFSVFNVTPVPEATTMIAGALLLLPFGVSALRMMRRKQASK